MTVALVLTKKRPTDGKPNPYRTRWVVAGGVLWRIHADWLDTPWFVEPDTDILMDGRGRAAETLDALHAYIVDDERVFEIVFRLADARTFITERVAAADWPQHRDTWRRLAEARGVDLTNVPLEG